jgi:hypothetical protein
MDEQKRSIPSKIDRFAVTLLSSNQKQKGSHKNQGEGLNKDENDKAQLTARKLKVSSTKKEKKERPIDFWKETKHCVNGGVCAVWRKFEQGHYITSE